MRRRLAVLGVAAAVTAGHAVAQPADTTGDTLAADPAEDGNTSEDAEPCGDESEPPPDPHDASGQPMRPYEVPARDGFGERRRKLVLSPEVGIVIRPAKDRSNVQYRPGFAWGVSARVELIDWMAVRFLARRTRQKVDVDRGGLAATESLSEVRFNHPDITSWLLGARIEPTWVVTPRLRLWLGLGGGWSTLEAEAPTGRLPGCTGDDCRILTARRTGSLIEVHGALAASYDLVRNRVLAAITFKGAWYTNQARDDRQGGSMFEDETQAFADGRLHRIIPLPEMAGEAEISASLGFVF